MKADSDRRAACGVAPNIEFIDIPPIIRTSYQYFTEARMSRLRQAGYVAPFTRLEDAVRIMAELQLGQTLSDADVADIVAFLGSLTGALPAHYAPPPVNPRVGAASGR